MSGHDVMARKVVKSHRGTLVKMTGDCMHAVFADPVDALGAAMTMQIALADMTKTQGLAAFALRRACRRGRAARQRLLRPGGQPRRPHHVGRARDQTLISQAVVELVRDRLVRTEEVIE